MFDYENEEFAEYCRADVEMTRMVYELNRRLMLKNTLKKIAKIIVKFLYISMFFIGALTISSEIAGGDIYALGWAFFATLFVGLIDSYLRN